MNRFSVEFGYRCKSIKTVCAIYSSFTFGVTSHGVIEWNETIFEFDFLENEATQGVTISSSVDFTDLSSNDDSVIRLKIMQHKRIFILVFVRPILFHAEISKAKFSVM